MTRIALLRHGPTRWNAEGRMQGRRDTELSPQGRAAVAAWRLPAEWSGADVISSPLQRCLETVATLRQSHPELTSATIDPRFIERDWGTWEGRTLAEMREELGPEMARREALGLDFRPDDGETMRETQQRVLPALADLARKQDRSLVVAHRGVIRAIYSLATGWDMRDKPAHKMVRDGLQIFELGADGAPTLAELNVSLLPETVE